MEFFVVDEPFHKLRLLLILEEPSAFLGSIVLVDEEEDNKLQDAIDGKFINLRLFEVEILKHLENDVLDDIYSVNFEV